MSKPYQAVDQIIHDLRDRRGLRQAWEAIDEDVREEIREEWARIVARQINEGEAGW
jgi:hypothetical protein